MTEAAGGGRAEMERRLIEKSLKDDAFRQRLLADPKAAVEETAETIYLVLPSASPVSEGGKLSDRELEAVSGGGSWSTCDHADPHCIDPD